MSRDVKVASYLGKFVIIQNKEFVDKRKQTPDAVIVCEICNSQDFYCKVIMDLLSLLLLLIIHSSTVIRQASSAFFVSNSHAAFYVAGATSLYLFCFDTCLGSYSKRK